jgi:hypothetical protein
MNNLVSFKKSNRCVKLVTLCSFVLLLPGCSITHKYGEMPKIKIENEFADKTSVRGKKGQLMLHFKWCF